MGKQYVCEKCGAIYTRMLINWPQFCSVECVGDTEPCACHADRRAGQTDTSTKANGRAQLKRGLTINHVGGSAPMWRPLLRQEMDHPESRASSGYARQKFFEALYASLGAPTIDIGLTYAANYLVQLQPEDLPGEMRSQYEQLRKALAKIPLSSPASYVIRPVSEEEARKLAKTIFEMYTKLMGGL